MPVAAECHSDDRVFEVSFDAEPWFQQASDDQIIDLAECGWGGDYEADEVAEYVSSANPDVQEMFAYLGRIAGRRDKKYACGFECTVDETSALEWLKEHRPALYQSVNPDGTAGQDRDSYSDTQDRKSYSVQ